MDGKELKTPENTVNDEHLNNVSGGYSGIDEDLAIKAGLTSAETGSLWNPTEYYWHGNLVSMTQAYAIAAFCKEFSREPESVSEAIDFYKSQAGTIKVIS